MVTLRSEKARRGCTTNYEVKGAATASSQPHYLSLPRPSHAIPLAVVESCAFGKKFTYMEIVLKVCHFSGACACVKIIFYFATNKK